MPPLLGDSASSSCSNPVLEVFIADVGQLKDPTTLEFIILKAETAGDQLKPVQVFPGAGRQAINLADCPTGQRLGLGHFVAPLVASTDLSGQSAGRFLIRWFYKLSVTGDEQTVEYEWELLAASDLSAPFLSYCMVRDLRAEGIPATDVPDERAILVLRRAAELVERATGRFFTPRRNVIKLDGNNARELLLGDVIIALEKLDIINQTLLGASGGLIDLDDVFVYSRHLSQRLLEPDDRENPKISFVKRTDLGGMVDPAEADLLFRNRLIFPVGSQNVEITALWGYTDPNPFRMADQVGVTPLPLRDACLRLAFREAPLISDLDSRQDRRRGPVKSERTLQQAVTYGTTGNDNLARASGLTGDPELDVLLAQFARPAALASA